ncbi:uncharacterized protein EDB93DRAFT_1101363 [Suillus bovinus]|uniref:uncharacterized protein n=1 Tax=Suillus bovinus TaxID=48563 RepID=UPI001B868E76|nr:uncharacterized protein EDB93DRAFT_1109508 [Suillus bovinus]XP_041311301.1 uncharacterized protein EDB93DRAFT_1101363 [Suillus bovinus]KAG2126896.1 hypothetical protein EDB93DRAFT_1109508 [Suillus bovinus]KAG2156964.1 hypothetical protein EDB93DRAFT_1101363 [Suillus bovinus]
MVHAGGRPVPSLINDNFERLDKVANSSGRYFWKCKHCGNLDNSLAPKSKVATIVCLTISSATARMLLLSFAKKPGHYYEQDSSGGVIKKRKKISTLDGYVDYPLSDEQAKLANIKLLRVMPTGRTGCSAGSAGSAGTTILK